MERTKLQAKSLLGIRICADRFDDDRIPARLAAKEGVPNKGGCMDAGVPVVLGNKQSPPPQK